jgi:hypothetical protein
MNRKNRILLRMNLWASTRHLALCLSALTLLSPLGSNVAAGQTPGAAGGSGAPPDNFTRTSTYAHTGDSDFANSRGLAVSLLTIRLGTQDRR